MQYTYTVYSNSNGDIAVIKRSDGAPFPIPWTDPDFQAWNAAQTTPATLSAVQQQIQSLKAMTYVQWQASVTAAQKDRILFELLQRALRNEIV